MKAHMREESSGGVPFLSSTTTSLPTSVLKMRTKSVESQSRIDHTVSFRPAFTSTWFTSYSTDCFAERRSSDAMLASIDLGRGAPPAAPSVARGFGCGGGEGLSLCVKDLKCSYTLYSHSRRRITREEGSDAYHPRCDVVNKMPRGRLCDFVSRRADCPLDCQPRTHARTRIPRRLTRQQQPHPTTTKSKDVEVD